MVTSVTPLSDRPLPRAVRRRCSGPSGFTLLEILVVLAIIGLLVGLAVKNVGKIFETKSEDSARMFVKSSLSAPLMAYKIDLGNFPSTGDGLRALIAPPSNNPERWRGPYLEPAQIPTDPWNEPYQYAFPGTKNRASYDLWSKGPDKTDGTADDIGNWTAGATEAPK